MIDLLSDAVTRPTPAMLDAMVAHAAKLQHAVRDEDPALLDLEREAARVTGKAAAVFLPTGTMANQVAIRAHCHGVAAPFVVAEARSHVVVHEGAGAAVNAGAELRVLRGRRGALPPEEVARLLAPPPRFTALLHAEPALVIAENTHNVEGGTVVPLEDMRRLHEVARAAGVPVHLDGARLFNAAVALGVEAKDVARHAETVMFSLTKGLGAPAGALLAGDVATMERARRYRQVMGGTMYKAGLLAAAGRVALAEGPKRLGEDHAHARLLADAVREAGVDVAPPDTNIVVFSTRPLGVGAEAFAERAAERGVRVAAISAHEVRAVTHRDVTGEMARRAGEALAATARALRVDARSADAPSG